MVGTIACFNVDRTPGGFNGAITIDYTPCMTTSNQLLALGLGEGRQPKIQRYVTPQEKAHLQGFQRIDIEGLTGTELLRGVGESFTVPVAGRILCMALEPIFKARCGQVSNKRARISGLRAYRETQPTIVVVCDASLPIQ